MLRHGGAGGGSCLPPLLEAAYSVLAVVDGVVAAVAFLQLLRIHLRSQQLGWTREKIFHLMIGSSNIGYLIYFVSTLLSTCKGWQCWSHGCGFILMACPQISFLAAFLLLLSFWVDLCHQPNDEDEDDDGNSYNEALLEKSKLKPGLLHADGRRKCCSFRTTNIGSRQKFVMLVVVLTFVFMVAFALLIWIGRGKNPIDSLLMARVYLDVFSAAILLLGVALACYGLLLFSKMRKVRSEMVSAEMWKVASLATLSLVCFTSSSLLALVTNIPVHCYWHSDHLDSIINSVFAFLYYFIADWWASYGVDSISRDVSLKRLAMRILGLTCADSGCERNWSTFEMIHTKKRNRLSAEKLRDLVYVAFNQKLRERQIARMERPDYYDPIELDDGLEDDHPWLVDTEEPVFQGETLTWAQVERAALGTDPGQSSSQGGRRRRGAAARANVLDWEAEETAQTGGGDDEDENEIVEEAEEEYPSYQVDTQYVLTDAEETEPSQEYIEEGDDTSSSDGGDIPHWIRDQTLI